MTFFYLVFTGSLSLWERKWPDRVLLCRMTVNVGLDWTAPRLLLSLIAYSGKQPHDITVKEKDVHT